ncbi:NahK/ErcS family hybrid sensor histidine kinase/response regulator [Methylobrevis albus]|uniref:histidine kinase n=1 Tax=Methylobrevis albus TaxID=2793297 RepID=A0A931I1Q8_9HYPH|nr:NahK/ErcS family hybrid sensor histidine kinase/response regulator [Methylobrevis albus]MBH0238620.1 response regulator [Methylobrevis albus]
MDRVERQTDVHGNAYSLFQTAINLELQVRARTEELTTVLRRLEHSNEELRLAKEQAEQANAYKTRFLAAASHDLLQPLNAARLSVSALKEMQTSHEGEVVTDQVDRALSTIEELLKTLLDISKLDAGVMLPEVKVVALGDILASLGSDFERISAQKGLSFRIRPTSAVVRTDPVLLRRVLQNLISNAVRYTRSGGIVVGVRGGGDRAEIAVADTGIGIPEAEQEVVFEEFRRGRGVGNADAAGLGLGLSIVKRICLALDHTLTMRSVEGRGTVFRVGLPRAPASELAPKVERGAPRSFGVSDARVLVIDNDPAVLAASSALLTRWSCRVATAADAAGALAAIERDGAPDVVLADYHLDDGQTGLGAVAALRARLGRDVPVVVVTADHGPAVAAAARAIGAEILNKPVKPAELRALLAHILA